MTALELRDIFASSAFREELAEMSSYLASIMQERPIIYLLAKHLRRRGYEFELELKQTDLVVAGKRVEFKMNYNRCEEDLAKVLDQYSGKLSGMWAAVEMGLLNKTWRVGPKIYQDVCVKCPDIFVWIILSRDLSEVPAAESRRIGFGGEQCKYNATRPYCPDGHSLEVIDRFLGLLRQERPFGLQKLDVETVADFPSTYHFRICEFPASS
jgi:hypothetical protein